MSRKTKDNQPNIQEILTKRAAFKSFAEQVSSGEILLKRRETITDKLDIIADELILLQHIPYVTLAAVLKERLGLAVSTDTVRTYCQQRLGFPSKASQRNTHSK